MQKRNAVTYICIEARNPSFAILVPNVFKQSRSTRPCRKDKAIKDEPTEKRPGDMMGPTKDRVDAHRQTITALFSARSFPNAQRLSTSTEIRRI